MMDGDQKILCIGGPIDGRWLQAVPAVRLVGPWDGEYRRVIDESGDKWVWEPDEEGSG